MLYKFVSPFIICSDVVRIRQLIGKGQNFSRRLREVAESLNQHHRNVKRAKFGGALSTFVGGGK